MIGYLRVVMLAFALVLMGCGGAAVRAQSQAANAIAVGANAALVTLAETYTLRGEALIDQAHSREEAEALLAEHRARWRPLWKAVDAFGATHNAWATGLETGMTSETTAAALVTAWCEIEDVAASLGVRVPEVIPCP